MLELFWTAGHHHQICVKKLLRGAKKYALQQLDLEDFEVCGMDEAQLSIDRLELCLACV
jgi:hypothetical protein